jgi:hypothetical protein
MGLLLEELFEETRHLLTNAFWWWCGWSALWSRWFVTWLPALSVCRSWLIRALWTLTFTTRLIAATFLIATRSLAL